MVDISAYRHASTLSAARLQNTHDKIVSADSGLGRLFNWCRTSSSAKAANRALALDFRQALVTTYGERKAADAFSQFIDLRSIHAGKPISSRQVHAVLTEADSLRTQAAIALERMKGIPSLGEPAYVPPPATSLLTSLRLAKPDAPQHLFDLTRAALAQTTDLLSEVPVTPEGRENFTLKAGSLHTLLGQLEVDMKKLPTSPASHELQWGVATAKKDLVAKEAEVERLYVEHPLNAKNVSSSRQNWYNAAIQYLEKTIADTHGTDSGSHTMPLVDMRGHIEQLQQADLRRFSDPLAPVENIEHELTSLAKDMEKLLHTAFQGTRTHRELKSALELSWKEVINTRPVWKTISNTAPLTLEGQRLMPSCITTPASCMENDVGRSYAKGTGVGCYAFAESNHAVNLAVSELVLPDAQGKLQTLFKGLRHGAHCAFGIKDRQERQAANLARATETVKAALLGNPALLAAAIADAEQPDQLAPPVRVPMVSVSLLTPDNLRATGFINFFKDMGRANEQRMVQEQTQAWNTLNAAPIHIDVTDANGSRHTVTVQPDITTFNFGVNGGALNMPRLPNLAGGWHISDKLNRTAMTQLETRLNAFQKSNASENDKSVARQLFGQINRLWEDGSYKTPGNEPYKMASRIGFLTFIMGENVCWNCKSGKDRTGNMDVEARFLALRTQVEGRVPEPNETLNSEQRAALRALALGSGNLELQAMNTGVPGFKLEGVWPNDERLGETEARAYFRGASSFVAS